VLSFGNKKMNANNLRANIRIKIMQALKGGGGKVEGARMRVKGGG
jgi:hypothetical protein